MYNIIGKLEYALFWHLIQVAPSAMHWLCVYGYPSHIESKRCVGRRLVQKAQIVCYVVYVCRRITKFLRVRFNLEVINQSSPL